MDSKQEPKRYHVFEDDLYADEQGEFISVKDPAYLLLKRDAENKRKLDELQSKWLAVSVMIEPDRVLLKLIGASLGDCKTFTAPSLTEAIEQVKS